MPKILIVAASGKGPILKASLEAAGHDVRLATSFPDAVDIAGQTSPDLLLTEVQLGAFNGLHVVIRHRGRHPNMRQIVIGPYYDSVLAHEATNCGATYVTANADDPELVGLVAGRLAEGNPARRWPRKKPIDPLVVQITDRSARILDLSYGGLRFETNEVPHLPASLKIVFPDCGSGHRGPADLVSAKRGRLVVVWRSYLRARPIRTCRRGASSSMQSPPLPKLFHPTQLFPFQHCRSTTDAALPAGESSADRDRRDVLARI